MILLFLLLLSLSIQLPLHLQATVKHVHLLEHSPFDPPLRLAPHHRRQFDPNYENQLWSNLKIEESLRLLQPTNRPPSTNLKLSEIMDSDTETFHKQVLETVMKSLDRGLKVAVATMSDRQDRLEETSMRQLSSLKDQMSGLLQALHSPPSPTRGTSPPSPSGGTSPPSPGRGTHSHPDMQGTSDQDASPNFDNSETKVILQAFTEPPLTDPDIDVASRTLGFSPIEEPLSTAEGTLCSSLYHFLHKHLALSSESLSTLHFSQL